MGLKRLIELVKRSAAIAVISLLHGAATVILITLPLAGDFDYEFNAALCVVSFLSSATIAIAVVRIFLGKGNEKAIAIAERNAYIFFKATAISALNLLCSLTVVGVSILFFHACASARGWQLFFLLPVTGGVVGSAFGFFIASWFRTRTWTIFFILVSASFVLNLLWLIWYVPIYVYSIFWGYFAGPIYDEWIPVSGTLVFHRMLAAGFALLFYLSGCLRNQIRAKRPIAREIAGVLVISVLVLFVYSRKSAIGFDVSYADLRDQLESKITTEHVQLFFDKNIPEKESRWISRLSEFYYGRISEFLNVRSNRLITLYIYADGVQKKRLMGARETNFSKVWNDEVHVNVEDCEDVLEHEMTHILANDFGNKYFGTTRVGFLEGLAVASAWSERFFTPHEWAAALKKQNELPEVISLINPWGFFRTYSRMSYVVSGSFTRFLIDAYGVEKFKKVYTDGDFARTYEKQLPALVAEWLKLLDTVSVSVADGHLARLLVQPSIFNKKCVHYVADLVEEGNEAYEAGHYSTAAALYSRALGIDDENPWLSVRRIRAQYYAGQRKEISTEIDLLISGHKLNYLLSASAELLKGDIHLQEGRLDSAIEIYKNITRQYVNLSDIYVLASLRIQFLSDAMIESLKKITATESPAERSTWLQNGTGSAAARLWLAKINFRQRHEANVQTLLREVEFNDKILELDRLNMLGESSLREYRIDEAINYFEKARGKAVRIMDVESITQRIELARWMKKQNFN